MPAQATKKKVSRLSLLSELRRLQGALDTAEEGLTSDEYHELLTELEVEVSERLEDFSEDDDEEEEDEDEDEETEEEPEAP